MSEGRYRSSKIAGLILFGFLLFLKVDDFIKEEWRPCGIVGRLQEDVCVRAFDDGETIFFMPDGESIVREASRGRIIIEPINFSLFPSRTVLKHSRWVENTAISTDGSLLATCVNIDRNDHFWFTDTGAEIWVWDVPNENVIYSHDAPIDSCNQIELTFFPDNLFLAVTDDEGIQFWQIGTWDKTQIYGDHVFAFSPDGEMIAFRTGRQTVSLQNYPDQREMSAFETDGDIIIGLAFSPDGALLAATTDEGVIYVWDLVNEALKLKLHQEPLSLSLDKAAFSNDGELLAFISLATGGDGILDIWNISEGSLITQKSLGGSVFPYTVVFSPDDSMIAIGTSDEALIFSVEALLRR